VADIGGRCESLGNACSTDSDCAYPEREWCDVSSGFCKQKYDLGECCILEYGDSQCTKDASCSTGEEVVNRKLGSSPPSNHYLRANRGVDQSDFTERSLIDFDPEEYIGSPLCRGNEIPSPSCEEIPTMCGGFAGFQCDCICDAGNDPICIDVPNDGCDPLNGGADCGGICDCTQSPPEPELCSDIVPAPVCGGFVGIGCSCFCDPEFSVKPLCVDDPSDECDPTDGGADCIGLCTC